MFPKILAAVGKIPKGKVATYGEVARGAGFPGAARQVVWALRSAGGVPWHRVVGAGGKIRLHGDNALEQRLRLELEGVRFRGSSIEMSRHEFHFKSPAMGRRKNSRPGRI